MRTGLIYVEEEVQIVSEDLSIRFTLLLRLDCSESLLDPEFIALFVLLNWFGR